MSTPRKNITLPREVYDRLAATGTTQDTFWQVVSRLLDEHEERARIVSWAVDIVRQRMDDLYGSFSTWGESEAAMEEMISGIPCADIRNAAREYLEQLREDQLAWEDECRREAEEAESKELEKLEMQRKDLEEAENGRN